MPALSTSLKKFGGAIAGVAGGSRELTNRLLLAGADVVTPWLADQVIVRLGLVALGEAKATKYEFLS